MPLSWNEIKGRAIAFAEDWGEASDERAQSQSFWIEFFAGFRLSLTSQPPTAAGARKGRARAAGVSKT